MGRPALAPDTPPLLHDRLEVPVWPELPTFHISRERFKSIGRNAADPAPNFRALSFNRLGYLYSVDQLDIREKILPEFGYRPDDGGILVPPATIEELGITDDPSSGLGFKRSPLRLDPMSRYCPPAEVDLLDVKSFCDFTCTVMELVRRGRTRQEQRDILTWKAGKRTSPSMVEHWARAGRVLVVAASSVPEVDN